jgi:PKHD-type hydroxylase
MNLLRINKEINPVYCINSFLSNEEINKIIKYVKDIEQDCGKINGKKEETNPFTPNYHIKDPNIGNVPRIRISNIKWIELNKKTNWLYKKIILQIHKVNQENFDMILKFVENLQFSEYTESQHSFYSKHTDCGDKKILENFVDIRKLSFSIQLTDEKEYEGGELILYINGNKFISPKTKGSIIFFESDIIHEVTPIKKGTRHSLVSWVQGPNLR